MQDPIESGPEDPQRPDKEGKSTAFALAGMVGIALLAVLAIALTRNERDGPRPVRLRRRRFAAAGSRSATSMRPRWHETPALPVEPARYVTTIRISSECPTRIVTRMRRESRTAIACSGSKHDS